MMVVYDRTSGESVHDGGVRQDQWRISTGRWCRTGHHHHVIHRDFAGPVENQYMMVVYDRTSGESVHDGGVRQDQWRIST